MKPSVITIIFKWMLVYALAGFPEMTVPVKLENLGCPFLRYLSLCITESATVKLPKFNMAALIMMRE